MLLTARSGECIARIARVAQFTVVTGRVIGTRLAPTYIPVN